jgi:hypothetical protein
MPTKFHETLPIGSKVDGTKSSETIIKVKVKKSRYTPWRHLGGEEV